MKEAEVARSLHAQQDNLHAAGIDVYLEVEGMKLTFPFKEDIDLASWDQSFPGFVYDFHDACAEVMETSRMPRHWVDFMHEVDAERKKNGAMYPINLIDGLILLSAEENEKFTALEIPKIEILEEAMDDMNSMQIAEAINKVLGNAELRESLKQVLSTCTPDVGNSLLSQGKIVNLLKSLGIESGVLLDLGCGMGGRTVQWAKKTGMQTIGIDRVYRQPWYKDTWNNHGEQNLQFVRGDFSKGIPFADGAIDAIVMEDVVPYVSEDALVRTVSEVKRVLRPNGVFVVGPQVTEEYGKWRVFRKEENGFVEEKFPLLVA